MSEVRKHGKRKRLNDKRIPYTNICGENGFNKQQLGTILIQKTVRFSNEPFNFKFSNKTRSKFFRI